MRRLGRRPPERGGAAGRREAERGGARRRGKRAAGAGRGLPGRAVGGGGGCHVAGCGWLAAVCPPRADNVRRRAVEN